MCKHGTRWLALSRLKANAFHYFRKTIGVSKTQQLRPEIGTAIYRVMENHSDFVKVKYSCPFSIKSESYTVNKYH